VQCKNHPEKEAAFHCVSCNNNFCQDCIDVRRLTADFTAYICRECAGKCEKLGDRKQAREQTTEVRIETKRYSFWEEIPKIFIYPFTGNGKWVLFAGSLFFGITFKIVQMAGLFGGPLAIILVSYLTVYMLQVIENTAYGSDEPPDWPDMAHYIDVVFGPLLLIMLATAMCYLPAAVYFFRTHNFDLILFLLLLAGQFLHPMFILSIATTERFSALNPIVVVASIFKVPVEYFVMFLLFVSMVIIQQISSALIGWVPLLGIFLKQFLMVYFLLAQMRLLGIFYRTNEEKLTGATKEEVERL
jgi:hypothetical protein